MNSAYILTKRWMRLIGHLPETPLDIKDKKMEFFLGLIREEFEDELVLAIEGWKDKARTKRYESEKERKKDIIDALGDLTVVINNMLIVLGVNGDELAQEIFLSNKSKFCDTVEEAEESVIKYQLAGIETYYEKMYTPSSDIPYYLIKRKSTGKILKGINFKEPDLEKFL